MFHFTQALAQHWPTDSWRDVTVVVAVSGGADSVALLCALAELKAADAGRGQMIAAHFNHRLRPAAADDARFVSDLAKKLKVPCEVGQAEEPLVADGGAGWEATARAARYEFLLQAAQRVGARYIATAHTADDQAETILHRVIRGTGLAGLAGIPRTRALSEAVTLIRPILEFSRAEVVEYLAARQQTFCQDETNADVSYTRNRIRHALLPQLAAQYNPQVREALLRLGQLAGEAQAVIEARAMVLYEQFVRVISSQQIAIAGDQLAQEPPHLVREVLIQIWKQQAWPMQQMGLEEWSSLAALMAGAQNGKQTTTLNLPGNIRAEMQSGELKLIRT